MVQLDRRSRYEQDEALYSGLRTVDFGEREGRGFDWSFVHSPDPPDYEDRA